MKHLNFLTALLLVTLLAKAEGGPKNAQAKLSMRGSLQLKFNAAVDTEAPKDSVLVIFDRYDHTGAGVVYQIYYQAKDHSITIPAIPEGKYYVTIQCLGIHRDRMETVIKIKSNKSETIRINQNDSEEFSKDKVVIPAYRPDFANLGICKMK
jgi:hypothetical protein